MQFARQRTFIEFGTGSVVGDNRILYYDASFLTQDIGFATRDAAGGHWQFKHITGIIKKIKLAQLMLYEFSKLNLVLQAKNSALYKHDKP